MAKIAITIENDLLKRIDLLVMSKSYPNRSKVIQDAVREKLKAIEKDRFKRECAKLDPEFERAVADEGINTEISEWSEY